MLVSLNSDNHNHIHYIIFFHNANVTSTFHVRINFTLILNKIENWGFWLSTMRSTSISSDVTMYWL